MLLQAQIQCPQLLVQGIQERMSAAIAKYYIGQTFTYCYRYSVSIRAWIMDPHPSCPTHDHGILVVLCQLCCRCACSLISQIKFGTNLLSKHQGTRQHSSSSMQGCQKEHGYICGILMVPWFQIDSQHFYSLYQSFCCPISGKMIGDGLIMFVFKI